jgi:hypothetical protein
LEQAVILQEAVVAVVMEQLIKLVRVEVVEAVKELLK